MRQIIKKIYDTLLRSYGCQGWYPLTELGNTTPVNITKSGSLSGYHPNDYSYPKTDNQRFEVCIGAIITQNTSWLSVEKALLNLKKLGALNAGKMNKLELAKLEEAIKPAGYFRQKAKKLKEFTRFYLSLKGRTPAREELLSVWGVGPETADSMLLYAFKVPSFVVDAYTRRIFANLGFVKEKASYDEIKELFEANLQPPDLVVYQEYHALLVEHAKRYYTKKEDYQKCPLYRIIKKFSKRE
ncbi:MAG: endonuclease III domain-containing protein [Nanoarchaeota archaeon]